MIKRLQQTVWTCVLVSGIAFGAMAHAAIFLAEGFEAEFVNGAPVGWTREFKTATLDWIRNPGDHRTNGAAVGGYNALLCTYQSGSGGSGDDETYLVTPAVDLAGVATATLEFWHKQAAWGSDQDTLRIYYKTNFAGSWIQLATYVSNVSAWTRRTIDLPNPTATYYIGFLGNARYGHGVCIDDVLVTDGTPGPSVTSITPHFGPSTGTVDITSLTGTHFQPGATTVILRKSGQNDIPANNVTVVSPTEVTCTFVLSGAPTGVWDVVLTNPDGGSAMLRGGFSIGRIVYVAPGGNDANTGLSWMAAKKTVSAGVTLAVAGDQVWVAAGTYKPTTGTSRTATFQMKNGVGIYGGFPGLPGQEGDFALRDPDAFPTVLSGDLAGNDGSGFSGNGENSYHVLTASGTGPSAVLDGSTITAANANGSDSNARGGGMFSDNGGPTLINCTFSANWAQNGGAIYVSCFTGASPKLVNCMFSANRADWQGGAIYSSGSDVQLTNCTFTGNSAVWYGGAMHILGSSPNLTNCTFSGNSAGLNGGAIYNDGGYATLVNCTLWDNRSVGTNKAGGIYNYGSPGTTLINCIVWSNLSKQILGTAAVTYSCVQGGWAGQGNLSADPGFLFPSGGDLHLTPGSPCIDAGNNAALPTELEQDLGGNPRFSDDPNTPDVGNPGVPPRPVADMGAYEYQPVAYTRLYVSGNAPPGGDGASWATAYQYLQNALAAASIRVDVTEIWVAAGVYKPDRDSAHPGGTGDRKATFSMVGGVAIYGGFPSQLAEQGGFTTRDPARHTTLLSGDLAGNDGPGFQNNAENSGNIVTANGLGPTTILDGFTISGGNTSGSGGPVSGSGLYSVSSSPALANCIFSGNWSGSGGAMWNAWGSPTLTDCMFVGNSAQSSGEGGALNTYNGNVTLTNCSFIANWSDFGGGAVNHHNGTLALTNCYFRNNSGDGAVCDFGSNAVLNNCIFDANHSTAFYGGSDAVLTNCTFTGNQGYAMSGGLYTLVNCTLLGNSQGAIETLDGYPPKKVVNCVVWANGHPQISRGATATYSCIQGGWPGEGNVDVDPLLSPDGHLQRCSPCIGMGTPTGAPLTDRDGEARSPAANPAMGSDEFLDSDMDGLPDWWEAKYFGQAGADPGADPDGDGLTNLQEYELFSSNPVAQPFWVALPPDGSDAYDGKAAAWDGTHGPTATIQAALNSATDGDTVLVSPGTYSNAGNYSLDYQQKSVIVRGSGGSSVTTIDCDNMGCAINLYYDYRYPNSIQNTFAVLDGFKIINGQSPYSTPAGGGVRTERSRFMLRNCKLENNYSRTMGGGIYSYLGRPTTLDGVTLAVNTAPVGNAGLLERSNIDLVGLLDLQAGTLESRSSWFYGPGAVNVGPGTTFKITGNAASDPASVFYSTISGLGTLLIDPGQQLTLAGNALLDMSDGQGHLGTITIHGKLVAQDEARVENSDLTVHQSKITTSAPIQYNNIYMLDAVGYGGEFFVKDNARVLRNRITSEGDRYLDFDPDPALPAHPIIDANTFKVKILTSPALPRGTLLELRGRDYECEPGGVNPGCVSGARQAPVSGRFGSDAAQNWVLDTLEILPGSRVTLTNRPGFEYHGPGVQETVYVKNLILHPDAVLNTGLQTLYYENLRDENGNLLDPNNLPGGRKIVDEPLLGFLLGLIGMNDTEPRPGFNEFDIRIAPRVRDTGDSQVCQCDGICENNSPSKDPTTCKEGSIRRMPDSRAPGDGVMEMRTKAVSKQAASSVAAKGSFARAGQENIVVVFEYQFINAGDAGDAEIVVKLSDNQDVGVSNYEVARVRPPVAGLPGSIGSNQYAVFYLVVPYDQWKTHLTKFVRGTYVELELRGKGAIVRIDNWDPQVICGDECASFDGVPGVTEADFLVLLAEYGHSVAADDPKSCLDVNFSRDHYIELSDLLSWDAYMAGGLDSCGSGGLAASVPRQKSQGKLTTSSQPPTTNALLVCGKSTIPGQQTDGLYTMTGAGNCSTSGTIPAGGSNTRANGRLVRDSKGKVYQLNGTQGLVRLDDGQIMVGPRSDLTAGSNAVLVGVNTSEDGFLGVPMMDAAFDPNDSTIVYVAPVVVAVPDSHTYKAVARLVLNPAQPGQYALDRLYGTDPWADPLVNTTTPPEASPYNIQKIRELEIDRSGSKLYVTSSDNLNNNEWLLIYDTASGAETRVRLTGLDTQLKSSSAMLASGLQDKLYFTSTVGPSAQVFRLDMTASPALEGGIVVPDTRQITSITENPADGTLYVVGFQVPSIPEDLSRTDPLYAQYFSNSSPVFTSPRLLKIAPAAAWTNSTTTAVPISGGNLALPTAAMYIPGTTTSPGDFNSDGVVDDQDMLIFVACSSGPATPYDPAHLGQDCTVVPDENGRIPPDFDADGDVDSDDFATFQRSYGP